MSIVLDDEHENLLDEYEDAEEEYANEGYRTVPLASFKDKTVELAVLRLPGEDPVYYASLLREKLNIKLF